MAVDFEQRTFSSALDRLVRIAVFAWLVLDVFDGVVRYGASLGGMPWLVYLRDGVMLMAALACLAVHPLRPRVLIYCIVLLAGAVTGLAYLETPLQVAVGLKVFLPFFAGLAIAGLPGPLFPRPRWLVALLLVTFLGVYLQSFIDYPWVGYQYDVGDFSVEGNRMWWATDEFVRLSGFCRASTSAAPLFFLLGLMNLQTERRRTLALGCWLLALGGIVLTTSKGLCVAWLGISALLVVRRLLRFDPGLANLITRAGVCLVAGIGIVLPLAQFQLMNGLERVSLGWFTFYSMGDRLEEYWPAALQLATQGGNVITGRGVGGIGAAMINFEPEIYNAADSLFLSLYVQFGIIAVAFLFVLALQGSKLLADARNPDRQAMGLFLIGMLVYGMVAAVMECSSASLIMGYAAGLVATAARPILLPPIDRHKRPPDVRRIVHSVVEPEPVVLAG
ncbi:MAG TPA: hypothetical protein VIK18_05465 [Pirellulales bacterium]